MSPIPHVLCSHGYKTHILLIIISAKKVIGSCGNRSFGSLFMHQRLRMAWQVRRKLNPLPHGACFSESTALQRRFQLAGAASTATGGAPTATGREDKKEGASQLGSIRLADSSRKVYSCTSRRPGYGRACPCCRSRLLCRTFPSSARPSPSTSVVEGRAMDAMFDAEKGMPAGERGRRDLDEALVNPP